MKSNLRKTASRILNSRLILLAGALTVLSATGCIIRTKHLPPDQILLPAESLTKPALLEKIKTSSTKLKTLFVSNSILKVTQQVSADQLKEFGKGVFTIGGIILVERPDKLRLQVELSGVTGADLGSDDRQFRIYIPHVLNAYGIGNVSAPVGEVSFPCNLRPSHILDALFVDGEKYLEDKNVLTVLREQVEGVRSYYLIDFISNTGTPIEELWYDRTDKQVTRKIHYAEDGRREAVVQYSNYATVDTIPFPKLIEINRPIERYSLEIKINEMAFNQAIPESKFLLDRPSTANDLDLKTCKTVKH